MDHKPFVAGGLSTNGKGQSSSSTLGEKINLDKIKRIAAQGASGAPIKSKILTVKLKPDSVKSFKTTETKKVGSKQQQIISSK